MIQTVVAPVVPGRMNQKELEQFLVEVRAAMNDVGRVRRDSTTAATAITTTIYESPAIPRGTGVNVKAVVRGFVPESPPDGAYFELAASFGRDQLGSAAVLITSSTITFFSPLGQTAAVVLGPDGNFIVRVNDAGAWRTEWSVWLEVYV